MTECERIIKGGIINEDFLIPETICDFYVDEKRKKTWTISLDLLLHFDRICRLHGLRYSLAFGSLLGAIRHNGFIPWDDDIDVMMPREDYEKLRKYKSEFQEPYFLQYPGEDKGYFMSWAKLRNSNTTSISRSFRYEEFNQGIFLDIFPLDNYNPKQLEENYAKIITLIAECSALMRRSNPTPDEVDIQKMSKFPIARDGIIVAKELDSILRQNDHLTSDKYIAWCCVIYDHKKMTFNKNIFDELKEINFYGYPIFITKYYDEVLRTTYGNYKELPPISERGSRHSQNIFNPDIPYKEVLRHLRQEF